MTDKRGPYLTLNWVRDYIANTPGAGPMQECVLHIETVFKPHADNRARFLRRARGLVAQALSEREASPAPAPTLPPVAGVLRAPEDTREQALGDTFVFTSAQANTFLNENFWNSLMALVNHKEAQLHISRFTYNKQQFGKNSVKPGTHEDSDDDDVWFDPRILPFVSDEALQITDDLVWCGDLNIIPTRVDPINGFENHGRGASVIIPHTKMAMRSIPTMKYDPARFAYSTGTVTARNYIEKAAGQKASLHHVYGALLVEVDRETGQWWARQLNADSDGVVYDITEKFMPDGTVTGNNRVSVVTHGDIHGNKVCMPVIKSMSLALDQLRPFHQFFHDTIDFQARNHHNIKDPHFLNEMFQQGKQSVETEFGLIGSVLSEFLARPYSQHYIVVSNHDQAVEGWLRNTDGFYDPPNQEFWLRLNHKAAVSRRNGSKYHPFCDTMYQCLDYSRFKWHMVKEDDSVKLHNIEHGMHGHIGPNGSRGSPKNLRVIGKANTGHTHSAGIVEGVYTAGVFGELDMGYNKGPSSWSHSFIITYANGKRTIVTMKDYKPWR